MNIRDAMLKAADHLEANPDSYNFQCGDIPGNGPGCLIVWTCRFAGITEGKIDSGSSPLGFGYGALMDFVGKSGLHGRVPLDWGASTSDARTGAKSLREFADAKYPAPAIKYPDWKAIAIAKDVGFVPAGVRV